MIKIVIMMVMCMMSIAAYCDSTFVTHCKITTYKANDGAKTKNGTVINNEKIKRGEMNIAAISRDLLWCIPLGSVIEIEGHGKFEIRDTTAKGLNHVVDILVHKDADAWMEKSVKVSLLKKPEIKAAVKNNVK